MNSRSHNGAAVGTANFRPDGVAGPSILPLDSWHAGYGAACPCMFAAYALKQFITAGVQVWTYLDKRQRTLARR